MSHRKVQLVLVNQASGVLQYFLVQVLIVLQRAVLEGRDASRINVVPESPAQEAFSFTCLGIFVAIIQFEGLRRHECRLRGIHICHLKGKAFPIGCLGFGIW